jgi:SAM-dependent methyltransferase
MFYKDFISAMGFKLCKKLFCRTNKKYSASFSEAEIISITPGGESHKIKKAFQNIYDNFVWQSTNNESRSGMGSILSNTVLVRKALCSIIKNYKITKMLDIGCGDWNWMKEITNELPAEYIGLDTVPSVVLSNNEKYNDGKLISFICDDSLSYLLKCADKEFDLILIRHNLEHLPNNYNRQLLKELIRCAKYALITSAKQERPDTNGECRFGDYRPINLLQAPYIEILGNPLEEIDDYCVGEPQGITFINLYKF